MDFERPVLFLISGLAVAILGDTPEEQLSGRLAHDVKYGPLDLDGTLFNTGKVNFGSHSGFH